jgi:signal transduction histidine kinase
VLKNYNDNLPEITCDKSKIEEAFFNIIKNALEAMNDSKTINPLLKLSIIMDNNEIIVTINDNGPGIRNEIRNRIFEPFFSTKEVNKGKGLGLSTSYFIITEHHKGNLRLESTEGIGSSFVITLPIEERRYMWK